MTTQTIQYVNESHYFIDKPVKRGWMGLARGQSPSGYGSKISTDRMLLFYDSSRKYRVYAVCHSNVASHYIVKDGQKLYLR